MLLSLKYLLQLSDQEIVFMPHDNSSHAFRVIVSLEKKAHLEQVLKSMKNDLSVRYSSFPILQSGDKKVFSFVIEIPSKTELQKYVDIKMTLDVIRLNWLFSVSASITSYTYFNIGTEKLGLELITDAQKLDHLVNKKIIKQYNRLSLTKMFVTNVDSELLQQEFNLFWEEMVGFFQTMLNEELAYNKVLLGSYDLSFKLSSVDEQKLLNHVKQLNDQYDLDLILKGKKSDYFLLIPGRSAAKIRAAMHSPVVQNFARNMAIICTQLGGSSQDHISDNNNYDPKLGNAGAPLVFVDNVPSGVITGNEVQENVDVVRENEIRENIGFVPSTPTSFGANM